MLATLDVVDAQSLDRRLPGRIAAAVLRVARLGALEVHGVVVGVLVPPMRSNELLSLFVPGVSRPVPSRQGLFGEPTPSRTVPVASTMRIPAKLDVGKSVMPVP